MRILIDTSVWIDLLRAVETRPTRLLRRLLVSGYPCLAPVVLQEILQGARSERDLDRLRQSFEALEMLPAPPATYARAGALYARCRWAGITPRSPHDCLIAATAADHGVPLLHDDRDFAALTRVEPDLRLVPV